MAYKSRDKVLFTLGTVALQQKTLI